MPSLLRVTGLIIGTGMTPTQLITKHTLIYYMCHEVFSLSTYMLSEPLLRAFAFRLTVAHTNRSLKRNRHLSFFVIVPFC